MQFVTVRDLRTRPAEIWKTLSEVREMVITNNGKPIALLTPVSDNTLEETLSASRKARAVQALKTMQELSRHNGNATMDDAAIQEEIDAVRAGSR